jgi:putative DNA primase/helicase
MDKNLERLNKIYPNGKYVLIPAYNPESFKDRPYDSAYDTKTAINKWKTNPLSYEQAQVELSKGNRIGWVVPNGMVVVDIDNKDDERSQEYIERILQKFEVKYSYNYTSKGIHILFTDPSGHIKSDSRTKCGINVEIDTRANETGYIVLPSNDPHRAWGEWNDYVEDIPYFLKPLAKDTTPTFIGMKDGDGRNNALFKWRSRLEQCGKLKKEEIEKSIRIINEYLFDEPMPNQELFKTVLKERDKQNTDKVDKENIYNNIADEIVGKFDIISFYDNFYSFNGTYYKPLEDLELEKIIHFDVSKNISKAGRREIMEFLKVKTQVKQEDFDKDWHKIACKNGILNLVTGQVEPPNKSDINTIYIPYEYNDDPEYSPRIDQFMKEIVNGDPLKMQFLYQIAGYCLLKKNLFEKFFIFKGEGGTGKSTFMNLLHKMVGGDINCSHIGLAEFDKDYYLSTMVSKLLNIDDDVVDGKILENTGRFKSIISGNIISVRQIYREVMSFSPYATCMFSCNRLPRIMDNTSGLYRRMILIELNNKVAKPDPLFMNKVTEQDMQYLLYKAVQGIKLAIMEGRFRISTSEEDLLNLFRRRQSPINEWLYENDMRIEDFHQKDCLPLYNQYVEWCTINGYGKLMTNFSFKESICALYDMELDRLRTEKGIKQVFVKRGLFDPTYKPF